MATEEEKKAWEQKIDAYQNRAGRGGVLAQLHSRGTPPKGSPQRGPATPSSITRTTRNGSSASASMLSRGDSDLTVEHSMISSPADDDYPAYMQDEDDEQEDHTLGVGRWLGSDLKENDAKPAMDRRASVRVRPQNTASSDSVDHALSTVKTFSAQLDELSEFSEDLPKVVVRALMDIKDKVSFVQATLEEELQQRDMRSDVEALLDLDNVNWDFNNPNANSFRARAVRVAHNQFRYTDWNLPSFRSTYPLPTASKRLFCSMSFPTESNLRHFKVEIKPEDSVSDLLQRGYNEFHKKHAKMSSSERLGPIDQYVLKAKGFREYLDPKESDVIKVFDHEYIRERLRNRLKIDLAMETRAPQWTPTEEDEKFAVEYSAKVSAETKVLTLHDHQDLDARFSRMDWVERSTMDSVPLSAITQFFRVQIIGVDNVDAARLPRIHEGVNQLFVQAFLFHGTQMLKNGVGSTPPTPLRSAPRWRHWITTAGTGGTVIPYNEIPRESRIAFLLYGKSHNEQQKNKDPEPPVLLAYVVLQLVDVHGFLTTGEVTLSMWPVEKPDSTSEKKIQDKREQGYYFIFRATTRENCVTKGNATKLKIRLPDFVQPVVAPLVERYDNSIRVQKRQSNAGSSSKLMRVFGTNDVARQLDKLKVATEDLFYHLTTEDRDVLQSRAAELLDDPGMLPKYLLSVDWSVQRKRHDAYRMLEAWKEPLPSARMGLALELLGAQYADYRVRDHAVRLMEKVPDDELQLYLLQLGQCLKLEPYHDSPLTRFLIKRALSNPYQIGHHFFWTLKAELNWQNPDFCERYGVILEEYLCHAGSFVAELRKQNNTVLRLQQVAEHIANLKNNLKQSKKQCMKVYVEQLKKLNVTFFSKMGSFHPPLNPKLEAKDLIIPSCRFMSSKKVPLLLWYNNNDAEAAPVSIIFKAGDDLRQDILTLQLLRVMDKIWLAEGLDLYMKPYVCIATGINALGEGVGMIETVTESETVADIQWKYGGENAGAAFNDTTITEYLKDKNKGPEFTDAVDRFMRSCAGYCVATYLLGIGDRHNDNYMVRKDGVFFHIDFGHFLGNWKYKMGICRERTKFVFTPEMCHVMGGKGSKKYQEFKDLCHRALLAARKHGRLLENLFSLMVSAGMPELVIEQDIYYLRDRLMLGEKDSHAKKAFSKELKESLSDRIRRIDNRFHLMKHKGG